MSATLLILALLPHVSGAEPTTTTATQIVVDPVSDSAVLGATLAFAVLLEAVVQTGEIRPQDPGDPNQLLGIDRGRALSDSYPDDHVSDVALIGMALFALSDVATIGLMDRGDDIVDYAIVYGQSAAITLAITSLTKLAVRRPRPAAYRAVRDGVELGPETNRSLSFFSGHTSMAGTLAGTATHLAWTRDAPPLEKWLITIGGLVLTTFVGAMRVVEGKHFPTDVLAGGLVGYGVGIIVPHLHLERGVSLSAHVEEDGATVGVSMAF